MIPRCIGCEYEFERGKKYLKRGLNVCFECLGEKRHLFISVFNKRGEAVLW